MLGWTRPATPNGIITSYTLVYFTPGQPASTIVFENTTLSAVVGLLNEFTEYTFELFASTSVGGGPNATDTASTDAAGMLEYFCHFVGSLLFNILSTAPSAAPQNVTAMALNSTSISVSWSSPPLADQNGMIVGYNISYTTDVQIEVITFNRSIVISDLQPFTNYNISVRAFTVAAGPPGSTIVTTDPAGKLESPTFTCSHLLYTAPSAAPQNVAGMAVDSTSISVSWSSPPLADQNGIIVGYNITYTDIEIELFTTELSIVISDLQPFTNYNVSVRALTVAAGPSGSTTVRTEPAGIVFHTTISAKFYYHFFVHSSVISSS